MNGTRRMMAACAGFVAVVGVVAPAWGQSAYQAGGSWPRQEQGNVNGAPNSSKTMTVDGNDDPSGLGPFTYVTGQAFSNGSQSYLMVARYDKDGNPSPAYDPATGTGWPQYWHELTEKKLGFNYGTAIAVTEGEFHAIEGIYVVGASSSSALGTGLDYILLKYNVNGVLQWSRRYDGAGGDDIPVAVVTDVGDGVHFSIYITGTVWNNGMGKDYTTLKYLSDGTFVWKRDYDGGLGMEDAAVDMALAPPPLGQQGAGRVLVTGTSYNVVSGNADIVTIAYGPDGGLLWQSANNPTGIARLDSGGTDTASGVAVAGPRVFVTGSAYRAATQTWDYVTMAFQMEVMGDPDPGWVNGPVYYDFGGNDLAQAIAANFNRLHEVPGSPGVYTRDPLVYVTGQSWGGEGPGYEIATVAYHAETGATAWSTLTGVADRWTFDHTHGWNDEAMSVISNQGGDVYVAGRSFNGSQDDYVMIRNNSYTGERNWTNDQDGAIFYMGPAGGADAATSIRFKANVDDNVDDLTPNLWVTGRSAVISGLWYATVRYYQSIP